MLTEAQERARSEFDDLVRDIRGDLHGYCSRMVGSAIEAEDIVQDALAATYYRLSRLADVTDLKGWIFRVAHNRSIDHLRRYDVRFVEELEAEPPAPDEAGALERSELAELGLSYFVKLTPMQRSCVILKDVLGYSMDEIAGILDVSVGAIKGALRRGRAGLRRLSGEGDDDAGTPELSEEEERLLRTYADRFNAHDFDALKALLAEDVRLELVGAHHARGREAVARYFGNYEKAEACIAAPGMVEGRPALLVSDSPDREPAYFILLEWQGGEVSAIRDFRYARHVLAAARG